LDRLQLIAPDLVPVLAAASPVQRHRVASEVARWVTSRVEHVPAEIAASLSGTPSPQFHQIVDRLDNEYLSLQAKEDVGECTDEEVLAAFSRARAASCVAFAIAADAGETIYEVAVATDDIAAIREIVRSSLNPTAA